MGKYRPRKRAKVKRTSEWKRYSGDYDTVSEGKEVVEVANKVTNRHACDFQPGQASSLLPPFSSSSPHQENFYTPPSPLHHNPCKPEAPTQAELLHIPTCSTFIDPSGLSDPTDAELYHFYI